MLIVTGEFCPSLPAGKIQNGNFALGVPKQKGEPQYDSPSFIPMDILV
jgi:hypothetical protein